MAKWKLKSSWKDTKPSKSNRIEPIDQVTCFQSFPRFGSDLDLAQAEKDLPDLMEVIEVKRNEDKSPVLDNNENLANMDDDELQAEEKTKVPCKRMVRLRPLQLCAFRIEELVQDFQGKLFCSDLEAAFTDKYKVPLCPGQFGFHSVNTLIQSGMGKLFTLRGRGARKLICPIGDAKGPVMSSSRSSTDIRSMDLKESRPRLDLFFKYSRKSIFKQSYFDRYPTASLPSSPNLPINHSESMNRGQDVRFSTLRHEVIRTPSYYQVVNLVRLLDTLCNLLTFQQRQAYQGYNRGHQGGGFGSSRYGNTNESSNHFLSGQDSLFSSSSRHGHSLSNHHYSSQREQQHYWQDLAQFGIYPSHQQHGQQHHRRNYGRSNNYSNSHYGGPGQNGFTRLSVSPALGSPIGAPMAFHPSPTERKRHLPSVQQSLKQSFLDKISD